MCLDESKSTAHGTDPTVIPPPLQEFIDLLARRFRTRTGAALVATILLGRLSQRLGLVTTTGLASASQRIFLASLIISTKLIHDTSLKNKYWLTFANGYFELDEINLMENQFLTLMYLINFTTLTELSCQDHEKGKKNLVLPDKIASHLGLIWNSILCLEPILSDLL
ncbi:hypothetical protein BC941DRAFT_501947 [Chlamydoabsidia padenii]|nr:hypothetical protein BC941DRAFT_501947 [Chlamydoabsidia padenii]